MDFGYDISDYEAIDPQYGRDGQRTPMQWDVPACGTQHGDATWLPVCPDYETRNVATQLKDSKSILNYYKALIPLRKGTAALFDGGMTLLDESNPHVLPWSRTKEGDGVVVTLNCAARRQTVELRREVGAKDLKTLLASFDAESRVAGAPVALPPYGAWLDQVCSPT